MPAERPDRTEFVRFSTMTTRLRDNDHYLHMNNSVYYEYFDSAVNEWLMTEGGLSLPDGPVLGLVVETQCTYFAEVKWPQRLEIGMRVDRVGRTSLTYGLGLFVEGEGESRAFCRYVHVYCDGATRRPTPLPETLAAAANAISV